MATAVAAFGILDGNENETVEFDSLPHVGNLVFVAREVRGVRGRLYKVVRVWWVDQSEGDIRMGPARVDLESLNCADPCELLPNLR